ncbi:DEAD/DEAH box helicase [Neobacillus cucumis]|uniref:DEAD/DEAH box helicase n=1 Tax=Neobacillus cucumis TaxID=1740721 RepID=UPI002E24FB0B|nr:DEAD/DEAH box helicase family protein [Neobacillus cucumis]MED4225642.1 DEAD/DEAH box helicase family protein [Neobacillus cucumis]
MKNVKWYKKAILTAHLRPYQIKAIEKSISYIKSSSLNQALIKMPTGTGKTFIIGVLACFIKGVDNVLVVSPSEAIRSQLYRELKNDLWRKIGIEDMPEKTVHQLFPKNISDLIEQQQGKVFITTIQALAKIKSEKIGEYNRLKEQVNLILFDEGHKEPAPSWSNTIRGFNKKTILFTATPIRNDHQIFNVDEDFFYSYPLSTAIKEEIVRDIDFNVVDLGMETHETKIKDFINHVIQLREEYISKNNFEPQVIIRFDNFVDIELAYSILAAKDEKVIAIHDRFKETKDNNNLFQNVPSLGNDATYWLHQNKLIEGIDNSKFAILAIFGAFVDARSLIQQVGRIIRRDEINNSKRGLVIVETSGIFQQTIWKTFCDTETDESAVNKLPSLNFKNLFANLMKIQPSYIYETKRFLKRFQYKRDLNFEDTYFKYKIPLKTNIFTFKEGFEISMANETLLKNLLEEKELNNEIVVQSYINNEQTINLIVYSKYNNSPFLNEESFIEVKLGLCFLGIYDNYLFFYDTNNRLPTFILELAIPLNSDSLNVLFSQESEFTEITLKNGVISQNNIHRQVINSRDIKETAPNITDKYNFCTTVTGRILESGKKRRRYVGYSNSRVSDNSTHVIFREYLEWIGNISKLIYAGQNHQDSFFNRFAPNINEPEDSTPIRILLDLGEIEEYIVDARGEIICIENQFYKVENGRFDIVINGHSLPMSVEYLNNKYNIKFIDPINNRKFKFNEEVVTDEYSFKENDHIIKFLNHYQFFQIITQDIKHIYYKKRFYRCEIPADDLRLTTIFQEYNLIGDKKIESEKGDLKTVRNMWSEDSLFYLVASLGSDIDESNGESLLKQSLSKMDYLICTDLQKEIADFIGVNISEKQVYFIHCKAKDAKYSASVFQDVCGQVMKNLDYAHPLSPREPNDLEMWNGDWEKENVKTKRIIKGDISSNEIWKKLKEIQSDPESTTNIWALTGKMFSLKTYLAQKRLGSDQYPEIIQTDYLLMNTLAATQSVGAKFRFFFDKKD